MPHKHKRKRDEDKSNFDLAPTTSHVQPLPAYKPASVFTSNDGGASNKRRKAGPSHQKRKAQDDTPKAFARMMAWQASGKRPNGLDEGTPAKSKKRKASTNTNTAPKQDDSPEKPDLEAEGITIDTVVGGPQSQSKPQPQSQPQPRPTPSTSTSTNNAAPIPKILPGESLGTFALRVDQSLPLSSMARSSAPNTNMPADLKPQGRITKHNKRLQKMISEWRTTDARLKQKQEDDDESMDERREEEGLLWDGVRAARMNRKGKKNKSKGLVDDDPWKELEKKRRAETRQKNLQDVVQAPPLLKKMDGKKFKVRDDDLDRVDGKAKQGDGAGVDVDRLLDGMDRVAKREERMAQRRGGGGGKGDSRGVHAQTIDKRKAAGRVRSNPVSRAITT